MAKETKKAANATTVELNEENVMDQIKNGNLLNDKHVQAAMEEIEKEEDEKKQREAKRAIMCAKYNNVKKFIELRARRREEKITKEDLSKSKEFLDELLGGKITPTEYQKKRSEWGKDVDKKYSESTKTTNEELRELRNSYAGNFSWEWERYDW